MPTDLSALLSSAAGAEMMALAATGERLFAVSAERLGRQARTEAAPVAPRSVAIVQMHGVLTPRGRGSMEDFCARLGATAANPDVGAIVLDVDSPGGTVARTMETANAVRAAAQVKPVVAIADTLMASAAYWIGAQASQLWVTPSGEVGSIGVRGMHFDISRALDKAGVTVSEFTSGAYKGELSMFAPLSDAARAHVHAQADASHEDFIRAVAEGRKVSADRVRSDFGQGRVIGAAQAKALGMVDHVGTMADVLASLRIKTGAVRRRTALAFA